jgi:cell division septal protein FtsQ
MRAASLRKKRSSKSMARRRISLHWLGRRRVKALSLSLLGVLTVVTVYLFASYDFYVFDISVEGNEAVSNEEIWEASEVEGYSIFFIDPKKVANAVASLPDVAEAEVRCHLPNRLSIRVRERQPYLIWLSGEESYYLDHEGYVLSPRHQTSLSLTLKDLGGGSLRAGDRINPQILEAANIYSSLLPQVKSFDYFQTYGLAFTTEEGEKVRLGTGDDAQAKLALLHILKEELKEKGIKAVVIDLRFDTPYYTADH